MHFVVHRRTSSPVILGITLRLRVIIKIGRTSIKIKIEVWAQRHDDLDEPAKVTEGIFTYVALDKDRRPRAVTS